MCFKKLYEFKLNKSFVSVLYHFVFWNVLCFICLFYIRWITDIQVQFLYNYKNFEKKLSGERRMYSRKQYCHVEEYFRINEIHSARF